MDRKYLITCEYGDSMTHIFNITDPITTGIIHTVSIPVIGTWQGVGLKIRDDKVLFLGFDPPDGKLVTVNVSSAGGYLPTAAVAILPSGPSAMVLDPNLNRVYISNVLQGLTAVDFNAAPFVINNEPFFQNLAGFTLEYGDPNLVFATYLGWGGYEVIDVSDVGDFHTLYHSTAINNPLGLVTQGDNMFVLDSDPIVTQKAAIKTVDISDPANAHVTAEYWIDDVVGGPLSLDGNTLAVGMVHGFKLLDVSNPLNIQTFFSYSNPTEDFYNVAIWGHYLFVGYNTGAPPSWVQAWDITNPAIPVAPPFGSGFNFAGTPADILFIGDSIFINRGTSIMALTLNPDPLNPTPLGGIAPTDNFDRMRIVGNMLYVIDKWNLEIYDVTDPTLFAPQGNVAIPNNGVDIPKHLEVAGLFAFTSASSLIQSFNVWPATTPAYVAQVSGTEFYYSADLMEDNGYLYQADWGKGIRIYDLY